MWHVVGQPLCYCPKISCTKFSDKMAYANSADPGSRLFASLPSIL